MNCRPHGLRLHATAPHDLTVQTLVPFLDAILGASRVTAERGGLGGQRAVDQWMQGAGAGACHAPNIIHRDYDKAGTHLLIDIKTLDAGPTNDTSLLTTPTVRAFLLTLLLPRVRRPPPYPPLHAPHHHCCQHLQGHQSRGHRLLLDGR